LFPAIEGANAIPMGFNFDETTSNLIKDVETKKKETPQETPTVVKIVENSDQIIPQPTAIVEGFYRENASIIIEQTMSEQNKVELDTLKTEFADFKKAYDTSKVEAERKVSDLNAQLETAKAVIGKFQETETQRLVVERSAKITELVSLRKEKGLPEKDYTKASEDVLMGDLETLRALKIASVSQGHAAVDDPTVVSAERKEDIREVIFGVRKDKKALKGLNSL
jgi:hypothetical protein